MIWGAVRQEEKGKEKRKEREKKRKTHKPHYPF